MFELYNETEDNVQLTVKSAVDYFKENLPDVI